MGILFEKKSLTFKSPDVIHHWDTHKHTYIREQTKGLPAISIEVMSNAFIWKKLTKTKPQREPQKADWVLKSAQHSVIIWQFLREGDRGKWEGYNQHNSKLGLYQKKSRIKSCLRDAAGKTSIIQKGRCCPETGAGEKRAKSCHSPSTADGRAALGWAQHHAVGARSSSAPRPLDDSSSTSKRALFSVGMLSSPIPPPALFLPVLSPRRFGN